MFLHDLLKYASRNSIGNSAIVLKIVNSSEKISNYVSN